MEEQQQQTEKTIDPSDNIDLQEHMEIVEELLNEELSLDKEQGLIKECVGQIIEELITKLETKEDEISIESPLIPNIDDISDYFEPSPDINLDQPSQENQADTVNASSEFIVEEILDKRIDDRGVPKYLVKWLGYPSSENTWEPVENLYDCDKVMERFELLRAERLARRLGKGQSNSKPTRNGPTEYKVEEIRGLTVLDGQRYFLVSLAGSHPPAFIRASLANKMFPHKVIDFYMQHLKWKQKPSSV